MVKLWKARAPKHSGGGASRYAHGNGVALRTSARRLSVIATAVCVASAMMLSYVVAFTAKGDSTLTGGAWDDSITDDGAISPPKTLSLGDNVTTTNDPDTGVATYVGGNMYVGEKIGSNSAEVQKNLNSATGITGSYAAEAEGLTLVDGRLVMKQVKNSWGGLGFRFGVVGFGSQFRPAETYTDGEGIEQDASVLAVHGLDKSDITQLMNSSDTDVAAWGTGQANNYGGGWVGFPSGGREFRYMATVPSDSSVSREWGNSTTPKYTSLARVLSGARMEGSWDTLEDPANSFKINGVEYANFGTDTLQKESQNLTGFTANGTYTTGSAPDASGLTRYKYDYFKHEVYNTQTVDSYKFEFTSGVNEKLITLTGDGESALQVFDVKASDLSNGTYSGVDFWFRNIPDTASVVVNVVNDDGTSTSTNTVDFNNGWRIWWGGDATSSITDSDVTEIGGYYSYTNSDSDNDPNMYAKRAQQVLWNFPYTTQLTIRGGKGTGNQTVKSKTGVEGTSRQMTTSDDPAAAWIGSIYVPDGGFQSHVSTNGRVYVGGDFEMDNSTKVQYSDGSQFTNFEGGNSASVIDMDQERHNLPWNAYYTQDSSAIGWGKVDNSDNKTLLSGASWSVYGSLDDAKSGTKAIISVTDNGSNDWNTEEGKVIVKGLKPNANYYIRETTAPEGYQLNTNIYTVQTKQKGDANVNFLTSRVYDKDGKEITASDDQMMHSVTADDGRTAYAIGDKKKGGSVSWMKYAKDDSSKTGLAGSSWTLTKTDASTATSWTVNDNTTAATGITLTQGDTTVGGGSVQVEAYKTITLEASVTPAEASQQVTWKSSDTNIAVVTDGVVTGVAAGTSSITACSVTNSSICSSVTVTVNAVNVNSLTVTSGGSTVAEASGDADKTVSAEADVKMFVNKTQLFQATADPDTVATSWSALNPDIATVSDSGLVTAKKTGSTTVVATAGNKSVRLHVTVIDVDSSKMVVYFHHTESGWTGDVYLKYQKNDGTWLTVGNYVKMKQASCSGDYVYAIIDKATSGKQFLFSNNNTNDSTAGWYKATGNANFSFTSGSAITVGVGKATDGAPDGTSCPTEVTSDLVGSSTTTAAAKTSGTVINATGKTLSTGTGTSHASDAVVRTTTDGAEPALRLAADTDTLEDTDSGVGKFTVKDLDDGTYTLKEATAPTGYTLNATSYSFTVEDGKVTWDNGVASLVDADGVLQVPDTQTVVTWYKVDGSNANDPSHSGKLSGSQWKITDASGDVFCLADNNAQIDPSRCVGDTTAYQDADGADGVISVKGLPVGTYTLKETVAPTLYQLADNTKYTFTVTTDASTAVKIDSSFTDLNGNGNKILNMGMTGSVTWKKTDEKGDALDGSEWLLTLYPDYAPNTPKYKKTVTDWIDTTSATNTCAGWNCDTNPGKGEITLKNLPWGRYELKETKAPAGHQLSTKTYGFTIVRASQSDSMDRTTLDIDLGSIENETSITSLPLTGGEWTPRNVVITGLVVLGVAAVSYGIARRRRRR
ncbi:SpaA isopeptide-forming pilin-related protein [Bifidobacterium thermophilum]|uniref:SpaA isopeptide-forming pilin-related protein n=1 Tax=Bifidobacterium thermophilum TaxID=33905 RepID=UPI0030A536EF